MTLDLNLWVSVALAIPLAIVANLFTPRIQKRLDERARRRKKLKVEEQQARRSKQLEELKNERDEVTLLRTEPTRLNEMFFKTLVKVALYGAFGTIYGAMFVFIGEIGDWDGLLGILGRTGSQFTALFVALLIYQQCRRVLRISSKLDDYDAYLAETNSIINELSRQEDQTSKG